MSDNDKTIVVGSDHAGFELKEKIKEYLKSKGYTVEDAGAKTMDPCDGYPQYASKVASLVADQKFKQGVLFCGTGIGASIAANRFKGVRAALCNNPEMASMSRKHNDSNVLVLGGRVTPAKTAYEIVDAWLESKFEGGRHQVRIEQLDNLDTLEE